ncbi:MAG: hypothetical protein C4292_07075 [Nitrososphaera sp.]
MNEGQKAIRRSAKKRPLLLLALALLIAGVALAAAYSREFTYNITLSIILGPAPPPQQYRVDFSYSIILGIILGGSPPSQQYLLVLGYSTMLGIFCPLCSQAASIIIPGNPTLSFALMLALIGTPALLLASAAGPPGLFVGLLIGGAMAFMAGLLPLWLIVLLALALITLIAFMIRSRHD